jgi:VWFA-related protein
MLHRSNRGWLGSWLSAAVAIALTASPSPAQQKPGPPPDDPGDELVFRSDTRLVVLYLGVFDKSGRVATSVTKDSIKVFENEVEQPIRVFRREDVPVSLGIVIDNSGSMRDKRQKVEAAAIKLVKAVKKTDEIFIVNFNDDAFLDQPFTNDLSKLEEGVARIDSRGGTAMRDALSMSIDHVKAEGKRDKKVLLVITDGNDTTSVGITLEKLVEKAQRSGVLIYCIGILGQEERRDAKRAQRAMETLTKASGGVAYFPLTVEEVDSIAEQVAADIRNQYVLAYSPTNQNLDGTYRRIKVTSGKLSIRTRTGYYATPEAPVRRSASQAPAQ